MVRDNIVQASEQVIGSYNTFTLHRRQPRRGRGGRIPNILVGGRQLEYYYYVHVRSDIADQY